MRNKLITFYFVIITKQKKDWIASVETMSANPYLTVHAMKGFIYEVSTRLDQPCLIFGY